ncbi:endonuclease/exonuclease/phosphatase family protein [Streptomyces thinghirensis]|nr:endonuclease/exonuclease/phosphatase family protein [Streptomyces thinghirensis]
MRVSFAPIYSLDPVEAGSPRREYGVAVLSRFPIRSATNHEITRLSTQDENPVPAPAPGFGEVTLKVRGVPVQVFVTHLDYRSDPAVRRRRSPTPDGSWHRERAALPGARQVLLGDFNAEPAAPELRPLWADLRDAGTGTGGTYPAAAPVKRIDYVAVGKGRAGARRLGAGRAGDLGSPAGGRGRLAVTEAGEGIGRGLRRLSGLRPPSRCGRPVPSGRRGGWGCGRRSARRPCHRRRAATISAAMERAVSSGVRAPRSRPMGDLRRASSRSVTPTSRRRVLRSRWVRREPIAPT